jgi:PPOX class probable F420-dependent enzyme
VSDEDRLRRFLDPAGRGVLVTLKRDGRPQISTIDFCFDPASSVARISTIEPSAKVANLRRDPRASLYVPAPGLGTYAVAEGDAELSAVSAEVDDATVEELVEVYRAVQGEHPDWDDYRRAMVADRRLVIRLRVDRFYGFAPGSG